MNTIKNDTERLKRELWHLKRVTLPGIEEKIIASSGGVDVSAITTRLDNVEAGISSLGTQTETNATAIGALDENVEGISATLATQKTQIASNTQNISTMASSLADVADSQSQLTDRVTAVETAQTEQAQSIKTITAEQTAQNTRLDNAEHKFMVNEDAHSALDDKADTAIIVANDNTLRIAQLENLLADLRQQVNKLSQSGGSGSTDTSALESQLTDLSTRVSSLETTVADHETRLAKVEEDVFFINGMLGL